MAAVFAVGLASCGQGIKQSPRKELTGYDPLKFGMTFNEAMSLSQIDQFNPYSLKECTVHKATHGCLLMPDGNLTEYRTVAGVPYGLTLSFNKRDQLTDITLSFQRNESIDEAEAISKADCLDIFERSVDWVTEKYGALDRPIMSDPKTPASKATAKKHRYWYSEPKDWRGYMADAGTLFAKGRKISVRSNYLKINGRASCDTSVEFSDDPRVERWKIDDARQAELDRVVKRAKAEPEDPSRYPYVAPDGVDITNAKDEENWRRYGTTRPGQGE